MIYAQILNNKIVNEIELEDESLASIFALGFQDCIRIDNLDPPPQKGWCYDSDLRIFSEPKPIVLDTQTTAQNQIQWGQYVILQLRIFSQGIPTNQIVTAITNIMPVIQLLTIGLLKNASDTLLAISNAPLLDTPFSVSDPQSPTVRDYFSALILQGIS